MTNEEYNELMALAKPPLNKYAPKLSFAQQCLALALWKRDYSQTAIADFLKVSNVVISHISNPASPRYRRVKDEYQALGDRAFFEKYVTKRDLLEVNQHATARLSSHDPRNHKDVGQPSKAAHRHANRIFNADYPMGGFVVVWIDGKGWGYKFPNEADDEATGMPGPNDVAVYGKTSTEVYEWAIKDGIG